MDILGLGIQISDRVRIGYFGFSDIQIKGNRNRSGIIWFWVGFGSDDIGFGFIRSHPKYILHNLITTSNILIMQLFQSSLKVDSILSTTNRNQMSLNSKMT